MTTKLGLNKSIHWLQGTAMTVGAVLGAGILVLPAITAGIAGPGALISWLLMGLLSLPMIAVIGMLATRFPDSGGFAAYTRRAFGDRISQITASLMLSAMPFGMPVTALIGANYLGDIFSWTTATVHIAAASLLLLAIFLNYRGIEFSSKVQVGVVVAIVCILVLAVFSALPNIDAKAFSPLFPHGLTAIGRAMSLIFFAFMGWEMIGHLSEEFKNPHRDLPISLTLSVIIINFLYFAVVFAVIGTSVYLADSPLTAMIQLTAGRFGQQASLLVAVLGFIACYCPIHTFIAGFSRLVYAQARDGDLPGCFARLHPAFHTPHKALLAFVPVNLIIIGLSYAFELNLEPLIHIPASNFLAVYLLGMCAGAKILPGKFRKALAVSGALLAMAIFSFSGWFMLFPLAIFLGRFFLPAKKFPAERLSDQSRFS